MKKDIIEDSLICLANAKLNDTSYEVARDIALDYIIDLQERIDKAMEYLKYGVEPEETEDYIYENLIKILKGE